MAAVSCRDPYVTVSLKRKTVVCVPKNGTGTMHSPEALEGPEHICTVTYCTSTVRPKTAYRKTRNENFDEHTTN